jgi:hypothetical protein
MKPDLTPGPSFKTLSSCATHIRLLCPYASLVLE